MKVLVIIDMQKDFCSGTLANPAAAALIPAIKERILDARENKEMVIFTQDTHMENYLETEEGKKLTVEHCIYGTDGWQIVDELKDDARLCVLKPSFASFDLIDRIRTLSNAMNERPEIEICGTATDICVVSNALMLRSAFYNDKVVVNESLCAGITKERHDAAIAVMRLCMIDII